MHLVQVRCKETPIILFLLTEIFVSDIILKVRQPLETEVPKFREDSTLISFLYPAQNIELVKKMGERKINAFGWDPHIITFYDRIIIYFILAMDCIPRISRAQVFDALSSMANITGYRAVIEAANHFPRFLSGEIIFMPNNRGLYY